jgi:hypothetical protein
LALKLRAKAAIADNSASRMLLNVIGFLSCMSPLRTMSHHAAALQRDAAIVNVIAMLQLLLRVRK